MLYCPAILCVCFGVLFCVCFWGAPFYIIREGIREYTSAVLYWILCRGSYKISQTKHNSVFSILCHLQWQRFCCAPLIRLLANINLITPNSHLKKKQQAHTILL